MALPVWLNILQVIWDVETDILPAYSVALETPIGSILNPDIVCNPVLTTRSPLAFVAVVYVPEVSVLPVYFIPMIQSSLYSFESSKPPIVM